MKERVCENCHSGSEINVSGTFIDQRISLSLILHLKIKHWFTRGICIHGTCKYIFCTCHQIVCISCIYIHSRWMLCMVYNGARVSTACNTPTDFRSNIQATVCIHAHMCQKKYIIIWYRIILNFNSHHTFLIRLNKLSLIENLCRRRPYNGI